jgi:hypothetical protein
MNPTKSERIILLTLIPLKKNDKERRRGLGMGERGSRMKNDIQKNDDKQCTTICNYWK